MKTFKQHKNEEFIFDSNEYDDLSTEELLQQIEESEKRRQKLISQFTPEELIKYKSLV